MLEQGHINNPPKVENVSERLSSFIEDLGVFLDVVKDKFIFVCHGLEKKFEYKEIKEIIDPALSCVQEIIKKKKTVTEEKVHLCGHFDYYEEKIRELNNEAFSKSVKEETLQRKLLALEKHFSQQLKEATGKNMGGRFKLGTRKDSLKRMQVKVGGHRVMRDHELSEYVQKYDEYVRLKKQMEVVQAKIDYLKTQLAKNRAEKGRIMNKHHELSSSVKTPHAKKSVVRNREIAREMETKLKNASDASKRLLFSRLESISMRIEDMEQQYDVELELLSQTRKVVSMYEESDSVIREKAKSDQLTMRRGGDPEKSSFPTQNVVMVLTDIAGSTAMWQRDIDVASQSLGIHNQCLRDMMDIYHGFEVKFEGDSFLVAFHDSIDALNFCMRGQMELLKQKWPTVLDDWPEAEVSYNHIDSRFLWRGLRVRMGIHKGQDVMCLIDEKTKRADYLGPVVNKTARVSDAARGGEILISEAVYFELMNCIDKLDYTPCVFDRGLYELKGIKGAEFLRAVFPLQLQDRVFPGTPATSLPKKSRKLVDAAMEIAIGQMEKIRTSEDNKKKSLEKSMVDFGATIFDLALKKKKKELQKYVARMQSVVATAKGFIERTKFDRGYKREVKRLRDDLKRMEKDNAEEEVVLPKVKQKGFSGRSSMSNVSKKGAKKKRKGNLGSNGNISRRNRSYSIDMKKKGREDAIKSEEKKKKKMRRLSMIESLNREMRENLTNRKRHKSNDYLDKIKKRNVLPQLKRHGSRSSGLTRNIGLTPAPSGITPEYHSGLAPTPSTLTSKGAFKSGLMFDEDNMFTIEKGKFM